MFLLELIFDDMVEWLFSIILWMVPEKTFGKCTRTILTVIVCVFNGILFLVLFLGFFAVISKDADTHLLGKYMCFVPLGIFALEIVLGIVVHLREKNKE